MAEMSEHIWDVEAAADTFDPPRPRDHTQAHVSSLIESTLQTIGRGYGGTPPEGIMPMGRIWERVGLDIVESRADADTTIVRQLIVSKDGIVGTLDAGIFHADGTTSVLELKLKFSLPRDPRDNFRYMSQVKSYAHMLGTNDVTMLIMHIAHGPPRCMLRSYDLRFTDTELAENWQMLLNVKEVADGDERATGPRVD